jgi:hypothetical protein
MYRVVGVEAKNERGAVIQANRRKFDFLAVADGPLVDASAPGRDRRRAFRMIDDDSIPVVVAYEPGFSAADGAGLLDRLRTSEVPRREHLRALQPFITSLRRAAFVRPEIASLCRSVIGDLVEWRGDYDSAGLAGQSGKGHVTVRPRGSHPLARALIDLRSQPVSELEGGRHRRGP